MAAAGSSQSHPSTDAMPPVQYSPQQKPRQVLPPAQPTQYWQPQQEYREDYRTGYLDQSYIPPTAPPTAPPTYATGESRTKWLTWSLVPVAIIGLGVPIGFYAAGLINKDNGGATNADAPTTSSTVAAPETITVTTEAEPSEEEHVDADEEEETDSGDDGEPTVEILVPYGSHAAEFPASADARLRTVDVRAGSHPDEGFDRVAFEFEGTGTPGFRIHYTATDNLEITVVGTSRDFSTVYGDGGSYGVSAGVVTDVFGGGVADDETEFVIETDQRYDFQVLRLTNPPRIAVDLRR
ncbi:AMIN-like domain-containing (lipo)protein [Corynebacterium aquatimens]|uniref:AMIN-like domain-containing protein n=2 Tax=Corynebacterium aquatimens TaxID=1190508 RepID=A0A931GXK8_9CORY|nr:hypothetical protein [Corynebacterium aquatimens]